MVHQFANGLTDGAYPFGGLVKANDGYLYGATEAGGAYAYGVLYRLDPATNAFTWLYTFTGPNGAYPDSAMIQASDGYLYGTTLNGGASNKGTVYKFGPLGASPNLTILHSFPTSGVAGLTVSVSPASVLGGNSSTGTVMLTAPAPSNGVAVTLSSNVKDVTVPQNVTIAAGASSATFPVTVSTTAAGGTATISATYETLTATAPLIVTQIIASLSLSPNPVACGNTSTGTVTLSSPAPAGGQVIALSSGNPLVATTPYNVTVPANGTTATFQVLTWNVKKLSYSAITAFYGNATQIVNLAVAPFGVSGLTLNPTSVVGGPTGTSTGTVTLNAPAPTGGVSVALSSNNSYATVPGIVSVAAGATSATFTMTTTSPAVTTTATITATYNATASATLTINPPTGAPTNLTATPGNNQVVLSWNGTNTATSYNVKRSATDGGPYATIASSTSTNYADTGLTNGTACYYVVTAVSGSGESANSNQASASPYRIKITNINNGDTLSGSVTIRAITSDMSIQYGDVMLSIDGIDYDSADIRVDGTGNNILTFVITTEDVLNGNHVISIDDTLGNKDSRTVVFDNDVNAISYDAMFDKTPGVKDLPGSSHLTAALPVAQPWTVDIKDNSGNVVKTYTGNGNSIDITWDGTNSTGVVVADDPYDIVITPQQTPKPGGGTGPGRAATRRVAKDSIGDTLILIDPNVMVGGTATLRDYEKFLHAELDLKVGTDFTRPIHIMEVDGARMNNDSRIRDRINNIFKQFLNLVYVDSHGGDLPHPFFGIGSYCWYSDDPGSDGHGGGRGAGRGATASNFNVRAMTAGLSYGDYNTPVSFVWMDNCDSAGSDHQGGVPYNWWGSPSPDGSWATTFGVSSAAGNGYSQGVFLGWGGQATSYGSNDGGNWTIWRRNLWDFLFAGGNNFQTAFTRANSVTTFTSLPNPKLSGLWLGIGTTSF